MLRVRTTFAYGAGTPGLMTQYFEVPTEDVAAAIRVRTQVGSLLGLALNLVLSNQVVWTIQEAVDQITSADGNIIGSLVDATPRTATGGGGVDQAPIASAGLVRWHTTTYVAGHNLQGRTFLSPMASAKVNTAGQLTATCVTAVNAGLVTWRAGLAVGDTQVIWHRPVGGAGGYTGAVTSAYASSKLAVLTTRRD